MASIGGMTGADAMMLTASQIKDAMKSIGTGVKGMSDRAVEREGALVERIRGDIGGIVQKRREQSGLTSEQMIQTGLGQSPLMAAAAGGTVDLAKSFMGMGEEKEDKDRSVEDTKQPFGAAVLGGAEDQSNFLPQLVSNTKEGFLASRGAWGVLLNFIKPILSSIEMMTYEGLDRDAKFYVDEQRKWDEEQDALARDRAERLEADREKGKGGTIVPADGADDGADGGEKKGGGLLGKLGGIFKRIPGFQMVSALFSGGLGAIKTLFSKLFWPITLIVGVISFVDGFMKGYEEGGIIEGITQGFEALINNLIDVPLNFLTGIVAWIAGALGFENIEATLNEFLEGGGFNLSSAARPIMDFFVWLGEKISGMATAAKDFVVGKFKGVMSWAGFDFDDEEVEAKPTPASTPKPTPKPTPKSEAIEEKKLSKDELNEERKLDEKIEYWNKKQEAIDDARNAPLYEQQAKDNRLGKIERTKARISGLKESRDKTRSKITWGRRDLRDDPENKELQKNLEENLVMQEQGHKTLEIQERILARLTADDPRTGAANQMQSAALNKTGASGGPVIAPVTITTDNSSTSGGGIMPLPMDLATDSTLAQPAQ